MMAVIVSGALMLTLGLCLAGILAAANKKLYVYEDPRIDTVESMLPAVNCGACGYAGCRAFAEAVVAGKAAPGRCSAGSLEMVSAIAAFLGVEAGQREKRVARVACAGGTNVARQYAVYEGIGSCRAASLVAGGGKSCTWGCLGHGDCLRACPFDAVIMNENGLPVVDEEKCTACGNCVGACPKRLISIHPLTHRLWVACNNRLRGKEAKESCAVACIGCGLCAKDAPEVIAMRDNLAMVDYEKNDQATMAAIRRCPTGAVVWLDFGRVIRGEKAAVPQNTRPLPVG